jgi:hypothetical protein
MDTTRQAVDPGEYIPRVGIVGNSGGRDVLRRLGALADARIRVQVA